MSDAKLGVVDFRLDVEGTSLMSVVEFLEQALVSSLRKPALLVQQVKDTKFL